jgi:hypothetical protein
MLTCPGVTGGLCRRGVRHTRVRGTGAGHTRATDDHRGTDSQRGCQAPHLTDAGRAGISLRIQ